MDEAYPFSCAAECQPVELALSGGAGATASIELQAPREIAIPVLLSVSAGGGAPGVEVAFAQATGAPVGCRYESEQEPAGTGDFYRFVGCDDGAAAGDALGITGIQMRYDALTGAGFAIGDDDAHLLLALGGHLGGLLDDVEIALVVDPREEQVRRVGLHGERRQLVRAGSRRCARKSCSGYR